jgi:hypothetical protein
VADTPQSAVQAAATAFYNLMGRIGVYGPSRVQQAAMNLNKVDTITGTHSHRKPPV